MDRASVERNTYDSTWYVQDVDGARTPLQIAEGGPPLRDYVSGAVLPARPVWSPDGVWIYYRARVGGRTSVWRAATDGSGVHEVTRDSADVREFVLSEDGSRLRYAVGAGREAVANAERAEYDAGVRLDASVMVSAGLFGSSLVDGQPATQRLLGGWFSTGPLLASTPERWRSIDLATLKATTLALDDAVSMPSRSDAAQPANALAVAVNSGDGRTVAVLPVDPKEESLLVGRESKLVLVRQARRGAPSRCEAALCIGQSISGVQWRPGTDEVVFTTMQYDAGRTQSIRAWNVATGGVRTVVASEGLLGGGQRYWDAPCAISGDTLVCVAAEADRPPRLEAIDLERGARRILFQPNRLLEEDLAARTPAQLIRWQDERGRAFTGHLFEATGAAAGAPPPLFVTFYNCVGFLRGGVGDEWPLAAMAEQGISALCINALPEFKRDFVERHDQGRLAVEAAVTRLAAERRIDASRVGMGGLSFGSEVALWTAANSDVLAAVSVSGVSPTPTYYLFNSLRDGFRSALETSWQLGAPTETPARWQAVSPAFHLARLRAPVLFQVPEQEYRNILDYALPLIRRSQADMYVFPDEPHIKFQPRHKLAANERNLDWFRFWLLGEESPDALKAGQYAAWREMRQRHQLAHSASDEH